MITRIAIVGWVLFSIFSLPAQSQRENVHRVRPPQNTEQYVKEANRVRNENLIKFLDLSDKQKAQLMKASENRAKKNKKQTIRFLKAEEAWKKAISEDSETHEKIAKEYDEKMQKILSSEQYDKYLEWLKENDISLLDPMDDTRPYNDPTEECNDDQKPGIGPIIKGPDPIILTE